MSKKKIFISYSRRDTEYVSNLVESLLGQGFDVWFDKDIRTGKEWDNTIEKEIKNADAMVLVLSKTSVESDNVKDEMSYAMQLNIGVNPIKIEECDVPMRLARKQFIDFTIGYEYGFKKLVEDINYNLNVVGAKPVEVKAPKTDVKIEGNPPNKPNKKLLIMVAAIVAIVVVFLTTDLLNFGDDSDDVPINLVETAVSDDASWVHTKRINTIKSYLDYKTKYTTNKKRVDSAAIKMNELAKMQGVVEYSETSGDTKENHFVIYKGEDDNTKTPVVGQHIISLETIEVDLEIQGKGKEKGSIEKRQVATVLAVQESGDKVYCTISYNQLTD